MLERSLVAFSLLGATWVLWLLVGLSVLSVSVMIERALFYFRRRVNARSLLEQLSPFLEKGDFAGAKGVLGDQDSMEAHVLRAGLNTFGKGPRVLSETMEAELVRQRSRFEAYLVFLGTLGNNAPFIGLFGTVLGIIKAFKDLSIGDPTKGAGAQAVMAGISEALVATAVGLAVALPAVVAFNYFKSVVKNAVSNTQSLSRTLAAQAEGAAVEK